MATLPQLIEEDIQQLDEVLRELLQKTEASTALVIDQGGFLICSHGDARQFDLTTIAALGSGAFMANQTIAGLVQETNFNSIYQQGDNHSVLVTAVDSYCMLLVIFKAQVSVGLVKYYAVPAAKRVARQMVVARDRDPGGGLDLSMLNLVDPSQVFKRKG